MFVESELTDLLAGLPDRFDTSTPPTLFTEISEQTFINYIKRGLLKGKYENEKWYINKDDFHLFIQERNSLNSTEKQ